MIAGGVACLALCLAAGDVKTGDLTGLVGLVARETWPEGKVPVGTGAFIDPDGHVLTAAHVIAGCKDITVTYRRSGKMETVDAVAVGIDARIDAALLVAGSARSSVYVSFMDDLPQKSDSLFVATRSEQAENLHTIAGRAHSLSGNAQARDVLLLDVQLNPGSSGAPVVDIDGNAVAYVVGRSRDRPELGIAIPSGSLVPFFRYFGLPPIGRTTGRIGGLFDALRDPPASSPTLKERLDMLTVSVQCR